MAFPFEPFLPLSPKELAERMRQGHPVDPQALDNTEYRGISLGLPGAIEKLTWKKFKKTFHRDPETGALRGWNIRIQDSPLSDPAWEYKRKGGEPVTFGHYLVRSAEGYAIPDAVGMGLMIDYGLGGNGRFDPVRKLRDPLVALEAGSVDALLGWSYVDLGPTQLKTPSYFLLLRDCELTHTATPPRRA